MGLQAEGPPVRRRWRQGTALSPSVASVAEASRANSEKLPNCSLSPQRTRPAAPPRTRFLNTEVLWSVSSKEVLAKGPQAISEFYLYDYLLNSFL